MFLSEINIYPIKSLGGIALQNAKVEERGLRYDRRWMLVDEKNNFLTQREFPKMATVGVEILNEGLHVSQNKSAKIISFAPNTNETTSVKIWSSRCRARVYESEINEWFGDVLETDCKLVLMPEETRRKVNYFYAVHEGDAVSFADGYPFLLIGENSLADLNSRLENELPMNRFRPNFVVKDSAPFAEDSWKKIKIGGTVFHVVKPCGRCVITTIDQIDGEKNGVEPLKTLATFRIPKRSVKKKILFGQNLIAENVGEVLSIGDEIEVLEVSNKKRDFRSDIIRNI
ncbi:MAG: MOSC domain-containing protein [Pyrinomonadaceae bacterium]